MNGNEECLLAMLILMLVILMLILMLLNLNTGYADTDADLCIRIMSLCCMYKCTKVNISAGKLQHLGLTLCLRSSSGAGWEYLFCIPPTVVCGALFLFFLHLNGHLLEL